MLIHIIWERAAGLTDKVRGGPESVSGANIASRPFPLAGFGRSM